MRRAAFIVTAIAAGCFVALRLKSPWPGSTPPEAGPKPTFQEPAEYRLPANDIPADVRKRLHPWIAGFIGLTPEQADRRVAERWSSIQRPSLQALRDTLSRFSVDSIVDHGEGGKIRAYRPTTKEAGIGDYWYLSPPLDSTEISRRLEPGGLQANEGMKEFLTHFAGLAEDTVISGHFVHSEAPWPLFDKSWGDDIEGFDEWENSLILYTARNGCDVLVRKDGRVAWWVMQEGKVEPLAKDMDEFVLLFDAHRKLSWPYDPYGPPDDAR